MFFRTFEPLKIPLFRVRGDILHFTWFFRDFPRVSCFISLYPIFSTLTPFFASFSSPLLFVPPLSFHVSLISASFSLLYTLLIYRNEACTLPRTLATSSNRATKASRYLFRRCVPDASELWTQMAGRQLKMEHGIQDDSSSFWLAGSNILIQKNIFSHLQEQASGFDCK